ncbi:WS/DGAT domain-containing protein [Pseudonocardia dioxanivorans]|uniref:WS/DGAT domain-containing protein n=1 Tax=Pseudonocardia dioxanivorans TaxID=240495 RepID=UPI000CD2BDFE|nr:WS/DGAT domain-containing protein [Pseudonocardia dioxanivorans]
MTWLRCRVADVRTVRRAFGGTFNDVVLAAVTGGLRELLSARGERLPARGVRSLVPVSVRAPGQEDVRDNRVSLLLADLPVHMADPVARFLAVRDELGRCKAAGEAEAGAAVVGLARHEPFPLVAAVVRSGWRIPQRTIVTVTTDVPGPRHTLYGLGRELQEIIPYVPIASTLRIGIAIMSYRDVVTIGLTGDDTVTDLDLLAAGIEGDLKRLVALAEADRQEPGELR